MARAIWSGTISFGLLNVPVRMFSAVARRNIALREIRESDNARIKHRRVAEGTDEEVPYEEIVKAWADAGDKPEDWTFEWNLLGQDGDTAFVQGLTTYLNGDPTYDNLWVIRFAGDGRAREFTEWYMARKNTPPGPN